MFSQLLWTQSDMMVSHSLLHLKVVGLDDQERNELDAEVKFWIQEIPLLFVPSVDCQATTSEPVVGLQRKAQKNSLVRSISIAF